MLRIDLIESQSSSIAKILTTAIKEQDDGAYAEHSMRLASNRGRVEELHWVPGEKTGQCIQDPQISGKSGLAVMKTLENLRSEEIKVAELPSDAQMLVRKGALELEADSE